jgi:hypothetical protein
VIEDVLDEQDMVLPARRLADDGLKAWQQVIERGYEGLVAKDPASPHVGGRTLKWLKVKQQDYRVEERGWDSRNRIPAMYHLRQYVEVGDLMAYGPSYTESFQQGAVLVDKILKGAAPADLPVEQPWRFELVINLKTRQGPRPDDPTVAPGAGGSGHRVTDASAPWTRVG